MKIGLFGGTFDPLHLGHLNVGVEILEKWKLDEIWYVPTLQNPLKKKSPLLPLEQRYEMLTLALANHPQLIPKNLEQKKTGPSYTIDILKELPQNIGNQYYFIIGADVMNTFHEWKDPLGIMDLTTLIIVNRDKRALDLKPFKDSPQVCDAVKKGWTPIRVMEISSTEIRKRLANHLFCGHLVPQIVLDFISAHRIYSTN